MLATITFVLCSASVIWVLLPRELALSFREESLIAGGDQHDAGDVADGYRAVCRWIEPYLDLNRRVLDGLADWLARGCLLLAVEAVFQTISLIT